MDGDWVDRGVLSLMKIVLAHPGVGPFVQQTARALLEAGLLESYWTTFADRPEARWRQALVQSASLIGANLGRERTAGCTGSAGKLSPHGTVFGNHQDAVDKYARRSASCRSFLGARGF